jgi:hypothetical protein
MNSVRGYEVDSSGSGYNQVVCSCKHSNEPSDSIRGAVNSVTSLGAINFSRRTRGFSDVHDLEEVDEQCMIGRLHM